LELQLTQIWQDVLNVHSVGVRDNFFDLGGHSLVAITLMERIQQKFGKNLSLATLFQGATIEHLASFLRQQTDSPSWSTLVPIQPEGPKRPLFCVHAGATTVLSYIDLARYLGSDQPFYGLESLGLDQEQKPYARIEDMAAHYIAAIQSVQPQGPYRLAGWCFGGLVAFEMARRLRAQDHSVALLALFDTARPRGSGRRSSSARLYYHARTLRRQGPLRYAKDTFWVVIKRRIQRLANKWALWTGHPLPHAFQRNFSLNQKAAANYKPQPYPGRVTLFRSADFWGSPDDPSLGWSSIVGEGVDVHEVPGGHRMFREPHVRVFAARLQASLEQTQANSP
jgi:thioesterase domain-containing protein/acyl carrier protein